MNAVVKALPLPSKAVCSGPEADLRLGDDHVALLDLVVEQIVELAHVDDADGRRELAVDHHMDAVRRGIDAMRGVRDRNVASVLRSVPAIDHLDAAHLLVVAALHRLLDALDIEDHRPGLLVIGHLARVVPLFGL